MHAVPPGFEEAAAGTATIVARTEVLEMVRGALRGAGTLCGHAASHPESTELRGRGTAHRIPAPGGAWVVRHYRRGGAMAALLGDRYLRGGATRPMLELWASERARRRGVPTPAVQCVVLHPAGIFYRGDIATLAVPGARDLAAATFGAAPLVGDRLATAWREAGILLRRAFVAGLDHPDLNLMNVLVDPAAEDSRAWLIDLDRAHVVEGEITARRRRAILARFHRSRRKLAAAAEREMPPPALAAFEEGLGG